MFNKLQKSVRLSGLVVIGAVLGLSVLVTGPASAVPQIMSTYGDQMAWSNAEINAMGGTGIAVYRGGLSNIFNPALLIAEDGRRFDASVALDQEHEDRFQPLFDSFGSRVVDAAISSTRNHYWQTGFGFAFNAGTEDQPVGIGLSLADRYGFSYTFDEDLLNPSPFDAEDPPLRDRFIEQRQREVTGTLRALSLGVGSQVNEGISFGAALHYNFGSRNEIRAVRDYWEADGDDSYRTEVDLDLEGVNHTLGLHAVVNDRVEVGVAWESALLVQGDRNTQRTDADGLQEGNSHQSIRYPNMYRIGLTFRPRTDPRTVFTIEAEHKPWTELEDSTVPGEDNPQGFKDVTEVRVGLEHLFYNDIPLRFGFRHFDSYADRDASVSVFSAGVGAPIGGGVLSASLELSKVSSLQEHQFPYPTVFDDNNFVSDDFARVDDSRFRIGLGYKVEF